MSKKSRTPVFTVTTPYSGTPQVTLMKDTWDEHIVAGHSEMAAHQTTVKNTLEQPVAVVPGTNEAENVIFVSNVVSQSGSPICVYVNSTDQVVASAGYNRGLKKLKKHEKLWPK